MDVVDRPGRELDALVRPRDGQSAEARHRFEAAQKRARSLGLAYRTNEELAEGSRDELFNRLRMLIERNAGDDEQEVRPSWAASQAPSLRPSR